MYDWNAIDQRGSMVEGDVFPEEEWMIPLDVGFLPAEEAKVNMATDEEYGIADDLAGEAGGHRPLQPPAGAEDV